VNGSLARPSSVSHTNEVLRLSDSVYSVDVLTADLSPAFARPFSLAPAARLALLTPVVLLVHGYHPFADDAGIYVAGVRRLLDPSLYPVNAAFVTAHTRFSIFAYILAGVVRHLGLPLAWLLFTTHLISIFAFLSACRMVAFRLFVTHSARWCAVYLAAACFTLPAAGTALSLMDPYVTARSFSTPLSLFAVAACIDRKWFRALLLLLLTGLMHPLMAVFAIMFVILHAFVAAGRVRTAIVLCLAACAASGLVFAAAHHLPVSPAYREAMQLRPFLFLARWQWFEVLGLVLPLLLLSLAAWKLGISTTKGAVCFTCVLLGVAGVLVAALFVPPSGPFPLVPFQVLRSFHLIYLLGVLLLGGILDQLRWKSGPAAGCVFAGLLFLMFGVQRILWADSSPIESPTTHMANPWEQAFLWIRANTPPDAVFAFNPHLGALPGEDQQGFRAISERDQLADDKDAGVAALLPPLADRWLRESNAEMAVDSMTDADRLAALRPLGANWLLLAPNANTALPCPYSNRVVKVCRLSI
jgi:hypothetical protein